MLRILIADDDHEDIEIFRQALHSATEHARLDIVHDGEALMKHLANDQIENPHFLFLDLTMPKQSGFECLNYVRKNGDYDDLKIIILSDSVNVGEIDDAYDLGANYFITKPSGLNEFKELLDFVLNHPVTTPPSRKEFVLRPQSAAIGR